MQGRVRVPVPTAVQPVSHGLDGLSRALEAPRVDSVGRDERPRCAESTSDVPRSKARADRAWSR
jgi:hypothetical protein